MPNEWVLSEQTHKFVKSHKWEVAVLPFGATEPHNYHLPYGTDVYQVEHVGRRACEAAYNRGAKVLLLPAVPFGVNMNFLEIEGAYACGVKPTTLLKIITDLTDALSRRGIRKFVLLNGHGGNELKPFARELHGRNDAFICVVDWFSVGRDERKIIFEAPGDHADEMETSMGLAFFPQLVKMEQAGSGKARPSRFAGVRDGWVQLSRPWDRLTEDTGVGDPSKATPEKAKQYVDLIAQRLGNFLFELAKSPMDETFPF